MFTLCSSERHIPDRAFHGLIHPARRPIERGATSGNHVPQHPQPEEDMVKRMLPWTHGPTARRGAVRRAIILSGALIAALALQSPAHSAPAAHTAAAPARPAVAAAYTWHKLNITMQAQQL